MYTVGLKTSGPFKPKRWILKPRLQHKKQTNKSCSGKINLGFNPIPIEGQIHALIFNNIALEIWTKDPGCSKKTSKILLRKIDRVY